jgi:hypothetical protein
MANTKLNKEQRDTLQFQVSGLAKSIESWWQEQMREDESLKKKDLFLRFPDLGSDSRFGKFVRCDFADTETSLADWHQDYTAVWNQIEDLGRARAAGGPRVLNSLSGVVAARKALIKLTAVNSTRRVCHITGESGTGKTCIVESLRARWGSRVVVVECTNVWNDKPNRLLRAICEAVGLKAAGHTVAGADLLMALRIWLCSTRTCLVFEEAHHMGPNMIDTVKSLVNCTPGEFVFISIPTLMRRLQMAAYEQARQLFNSHRLFSTIKLSLTPADAALMLEDRLGKFEGVKDAARWLCEATRAPRHGNLGYIRDVADEILEQRTRAGITEPVKLADVQHAAVRVIEER